ncbi:hypothetical protein GCM10010149_31800 [Nonomuraea roseoviolacea subsp. roseoviolacea]|uniref:Histidine kinase/HSP90-like ATPase domain-containing protein n=1 Tax=Nonomuraea roseoviolacea subsp. carminata TaxID=160689 RepID=A0ABT1K3U6_9ACTN|nr:ATP-binding protein [Nonomuraea roseoviolacea]MCP2348292.1 hypothetical protein [Nonomuraea roseoviolacea subsp. carminata]
MNARPWISLIAAISGTATAGCRVASWRFPARPDQVGRARRLVRRKLAAWGHSAQSEIAELLVSELVSNAMEHAYGPVGVSLSEEDGLLRVEVEDSDPELPQVRLSRRHDERGRGLQLVDMLACCWGGDHTPRGKVVWFELPAPVPEPAPEGPDGAGSAKHTERGHSWGLAAMSAKPF